MTLWGRLRVRLPELASASLCCFLGDDLEDGIVFE